jgi:hypothetical protein
MGTAAHGSDPEIWWRGVADAAQRFNDITAQEDPVPDTFRRYLDLMAGAGSTDSAEKLCDDIGRAATLGYTDVVTPWPRQSEPFAGTLPVIERLAERLNDGELAT